MRAEVARHVAAWIFASSWDVSPDGQWLAACFDSQFVLYDATSLEELGRSERVPSLGLDATASFSPDGRTFCVRDSGWGTLEVFDPSTQQHLATFKHGERFLFHEGMFAYSPDSQLIANTYLASGDPKYCIYLDVWSSKTQKRVVHRLVSATGGNTDYTGTRQSPVAFSRDGKLLAVASRKMVP